ncbi:B3 domain-containing protein At5g24050-like [Malania oleifera]|uniref:B3 domain-containing protein At5g24050-like n=1 Tax=Malania oleifera TaxID=397392 RepID=UPI0025ADEC64|nr:B3 domain-containing protein At5g24050-like [Malania oleifera]
MEKKELRLLSAEDFAGFDIPTNPFEMLLVVARLASVVREKSLKRPAPFPCCVSDPSIASSSHQTQSSCRLETEQGSKRKQRRHQEQGEPSNPTALRQINPSSVHSNAIGMPYYLRNYISRISGTDMVLVIRKRLSETDVNPNHNRLSIPFRQARAEFLTAQEKQSLFERSHDGKKLKGMEVPMIVHPVLGEFVSVNLKRWDMKKGNGKTSSSYVLVSAWNKVVTDHMLRRDDEIQLWSFRRNRQLCFALFRF